MDLFFRHINNFSSGTENKQHFIILHGLFGMSDNWLSVGKVLAEHFSVFLIDQRNHGQSYHSDIFNYQAMSDDLLEFFTTHRIENAIILGHSMGGKTAIRFAAEHPEKVLKLIVVDIGLRYYPVHHHEILNALLALKPENFSSRKQAEEELSKYIADTDVRRFLLKNLYRKNTEKQTLAWRFNLDGITRNIENAGEEIRPLFPVTIPALFMRGENSSYISDNDLMDIKAVFTNVQLYTVPRSGHWIHADNPSDFLRCVMDFAGFTADYS